MSSAKTTAPSLTPTDFAIVAFKHKWKVLLCTIAGLTAATVFYFTNPPQYESDAKILVRYVVERSAVDPVDGQSGNASNRPNDTVLNSEVEILNSWDLFEQVAQEIGPNRLCPATPDATTDSGARAIAVGLTVTSVPGTDVILITYKSPNPDLAPEVLQSLIEAYFTKHLDIHRSKVAFDLVSQQTDIIHGELEKTEEELKQKKAEADIISVDDTANDLNLEIANTQREIDTQRTALAEQTALVNELDKIDGDGGSAPAAAPGRKPGAAATSGTAQPSVMLGQGATAPASAEEVERYQECIEQIESLQRKEGDLLITYNADATPVQMNRAQLEQLRTERRQMEKQHPDLVEKASESGGTEPSHGYDIVTERARLVSMQAGMKALETHLDSVQQQERDFAKVAPEIVSLERTERLQQADYENSQTKLQNATVDEALDPSKIPNISIVQKPSPAMRVAGKRQNTALALAGGGFGVGFGLALVIELMLDQTVRRPVELEQRLGIPLWLSIPFTSGKKNKRLPAPNGSGGGSSALIVPNGNAEVAPWEVTHFVRPYAETIRDRLGLYFEANNMTHRPKLLAITGSGGGAGTSTLAAGIASALSETGEGKVLLVDMNPGRTEAHPFFQGRPACSLAAALSNEGKLTSAADNLYLATTSQNGASNGSFGLKRLRELIPNIKESDFDFVLFDMPPLGQTSPTASMAAYMDNVIFVVESENAQRDTVKRDYAQLIGRKPDVLVILNKTRTYAPKWIDKGS
jgi:uncharacterized protein involved in exopolysaccharide biosynthesis/Mrp family chromosome partitioning ATPase